MTNYLKGLWLALFLLLVQLQAQAQFTGIRLSPEAKISLITCSSGEELYSTFGHSAVRVNDPSTGMDIIFNYGTFDFNEPNFYLKFAQGKLNYKLSAAYFQDFVYAYVADNRGVYEQVLNFTPEQKQQYWDFLTNNYLPENQFYLYDFFFDNCATRIRDGIEATFPNQIQFNLAHLDKNMSFRNLTDLYLDPQPWGDFGIDLGLGSRIDRTATPYEYMFLPDYLSEGLANATIQQNGKAVPLAGKMQVVYEKKHAEESLSLFTPTVFWWLLFATAVALTFINYRKRNWSKAFDTILYLLFGLLGLALLLLWVATDHQGTADNYNLLWAIPTHLLIFVYLLRNSFPKWVVAYLAITAVIAAVLVLGWLWWPQQFHASFLPLVLTIGLRSAYMVWFSRTKQKVTT
ncbi:Lnb N-terminal periplasmic domain-containing protein [Pontibacter beigongshangensis]|uniref:Lnb N-terminal periplasmic domain-containing protein n=1 Tax=Pontibacter beigongshangensis TaxID=2574733 RepID=UPI0016502B7A|nr:DUF4105 domain-containing protein [Pontibacter beigongshangensis]